MCILNPYGIDLHGNTDNLTDTVIAGIQDIHDKRKLGRITDILYRGTSGIVVFRTSLVGHTDTRPFKIVNYDGVDRVFYCGMYRSV